MKIWKKYPKFWVIRVLLWGKALFGSVTALSDVSLTVLGSQRSMSLPHMKSSTITHVNTPLGHHFIKRTLHCVKDVQKAFTVILYHLVGTTFLSWRSPKYFGRQKDPSKCTWYQDTLFFQGVHTVLNVLVHTLSWTAPNAEYTVHAVCSG